MTDPLPTLDGQALEKAYTAYIDHAASSEERGIAARLRSAIIAYQRALPAPSAATPHPVADAEGRVKVYVSTMTTSAGDEHFVTIEVDGRTITPHKFTDKAKAEFEVEEYRHVLLGTPKPNMIDWLDRFSDPGSVTTEAGAGEVEPVAWRWRYRDDENWAGLSFEPITDGPARVARGTDRIIDPLIPASALTAVRADLARVTKEREDARHEVWNLGLAVGVIAKWPKKHSNQLYATGWAKRTATILERWGLPDRAIEVLRVTSNYTRDNPELAKAAAEISDRAALPKPSGAP